MEPVDEPPFLLVQYPDIGCDASHRRSSMKPVQLGWAAAAIVLGLAAGCAEPVEDESGGDETSEAADEPEGEDAEAWADEIEADLLEALGVKRFQQTCPDVSWACGISDVSANAVGTLNVTEQVDDLSEGEAEDAAVAILNFVGEEHEDLEWVVVHDASGTVAGQAQRSDAPLLGG